MSEWASSPQQPQQLYECVQNEDGFENTVTVRCCNDKVYDFFKSGIVTKCKGLSKRIIVRNDPVETALNASVFPAVPDILPENLFVGTDDCFKSVHGTFWSRLHLFERAIVPF